MLNQEELTKDSAAANPYAQTGGSASTTPSNTTTTPTVSIDPSSGVGGSGIISGAISSAAPAPTTTTAAPTANSTITQNSAQAYTPAQRTIDASTDTSAGQVNSMLANDSPLLQRARALAKQGMAQRGLVNSSMSQGAGVGAMIDRVTPLAQQDASIYNTVKSENMAAQNAANQMNVSEQNKFSLQGNQNQVNMQMQAQELAQKQSMFNAEQANLDKRQLIQNQAEMDKLGLQIKANRDTIPTSFAANMSTTVMDGVKEIMADGNMTADAKKAAINNLTTYANAQIAWAEKFYGATIPAITAPV